ncbi:hypothetical protein [Adlercreutzia caecimuris]|uniref:hypothetical protein n=1 Tax=Adlercreutzia caecimuris TaxID=671266 RepID=UPI002494F552|nr:hypothetical protein [Adlercreutzia caecimuris]
MTETLRLRRRTAALLLTAALALGAMGAAATAQPAFADDVATDSTTTPATTAIDKVTVSKAKFTYTGYVIKPKITVKAGGKTAASNIVKSNTNFTIEPSGTIKKSRHLQDQGDGPRGLHRHENRYREGASEEADREEAQRDK